MLTPMERAELERLERENEAKRRSLISRGELEEALKAVEERLTAWWTDEDPDRRSAVVASNLGVSVDRLPPPLAANPVAVARGIFERLRAQHLDGFPPDAEGHPTPRRPDIVAERTDSIWRAMIRGLADSDPAAG